MNTARPPGFHIPEVFVLFRGILREFCRTGQDLHDLAHNGGAFEFCKGVSRGEGGGFGAQQADIPLRRLDRGMAEKGLDLLLRHIERQHGGGGGVAQGMGANVVPPGDGLDVPVHDLGNAEAVERVPFGALLRLYTFFT